MGFRILTVLCGRIEAAEAGAENVLQGVEQLSEAVEMIIANQVGIPLLASMACDVPCFSRSDCNVGSQKRIEEEIEGREVEGGGGDGEGGASNGGGGGSRELRARVEALEASHRELLGEESHRDGGEGVQEGKGGGAFARLLGRVAVLEDFAGLVGDEMPITASASPESPTKGMRGGAELSYSKRHDEAREGRWGDEVHAAGAGGGGGAAVGTPMLTRAGSLKVRISELEGLVGRISEPEGLKGRISELEELRGRISELDGLKGRISELEELKGRIVEIEGGLEMIKGEAEMQKKEQGERRDEEERERRIVALEERVVRVEKAGGGGGGGASAQADPPTPGKLGARIGAFEKRLSGTSGSGGEMDEIRSRLEALERGSSSARRALDTGGGSGVREKLEKIEGERDASHSSGMTPRGDRQGEKGSPRPS